MNDLNDKQKEQLALFVAESFTGIADMILDSSDPSTCFAMVMDAIGETTEHIAHCDKCEHPAELKAVALEFNTRLQKMMGMIPEGPLN